MSYAGLRLEPHERVLRAALRTRCVCKRWCHVGEHILWDVQARRTTGCVGCVLRYADDDDGPDPEGHPDALWASLEDYSIFHGDS